MNRCVIDMKLPSLNEYINVCRKNPYAASKYKRDVENAIMLFTNRLPSFAGPVKIHFFWMESSKRRDLDNVSFAKKFILDAMVKSGKLPDDSRKYVIGFTDHFGYAERTKVIIEIEEAHYDTVE